jgi:tetratricopeptide (TPR) repeat protein
LARLYYFQGRYSEAESLYQKALSLKQRLRGEEHPDVASSYNIPLPLPVTTIWLISTYPKESTSKQNLYFKKLWKLLNLL